MATSLTSKMLLRNSKTIGQTYKFHNIAFRNRITESLSKTNPSIARQLIFESTKRNVFSSQLYATPCKTSVISIQQNSYSSQSGYSSQTSQDNNLLCNLRYNGTNNFFNGGRTNLGLNSIVFCKSVNVRFFSTSKNDNSKDDDPPNLQPTLFQRFKQMYRDYWYVLVPVHLVTSACWFGGFYYAVKSGIDIVGILESLHVSQTITNSLKDSSMGYIAVSYALYKIFTPLRYTVTLGGTTISIKYLKEWGYIKPVPSTQQLKDLYETKRNNIIESMKETKEMYKERKENFKQQIQDTKIELMQKKDTLKNKKEEVMEDWETKLKQIKEETKNIKLPEQKPAPILRNTQSNLQRKKPST